jgi:transcription initiation factor IIE alpha subunit
MALLHEAALETAQRLVRTVALAFYADEIVVLLDVFIRERYLKDNNMHQHVGVSAKLVSQILCVVLRCF